MSTGTLVEVLAQLVACTIVAWACGVMFVAPIRARLPGTEGPGSPEMVLFSMLGFFGLAVVAMVANVVTGGAVFGIAVLVPALGVVVVAAAVRKQPPRWPRVEPKHRVVLLLGLLLIVVFAVPVVLGGSSVRSGDPPWHLGWTEQLLAGEPVPTGPAPEFGRNAYPWGYHALLATMVRLVPGTDQLIAHESMHLVLIGAIPLAAACLVRLVNRRAGSTAAWLAGLVGGFGWMGSSTSAFVASPSEARYGADLVVASPNSVYELFPPALPREVALVALGAATVLLALSIRAADRRLQVISGAALGAVGLISVPMLLNAVAWTLAVCLLAVRRERLRTAVAVLAGALGVFALWAGPVVRDYLRFDGFVNITPQLGVEWDLGVALASWGILLPLAIGGIAILLSQPPVLNRPLLACLAGSGALLALSIARARFDWGLFGNETLLHQGRMWPPLHLLGAAVGALAVVAAYGWLRQRGRALGGIVATGVVLLGLASPLVAARGITSILRNDAKGFDYAERDLAEGGFVREAASHLGPDDVVEVQGSDDLAFLLFQFSGTKLASYDDPRLVGNELRIRFSALADRWDAQMLGEGFHPDYIVRPAAGPILDGAPLEQGVFRNEVWEMVAVDG